jgi:hypothetical protein
MENAKQPVNPIQYQDGWNENKIGLTKREYFAGLAMQTTGSFISFKERAEYSVKLADALLAELEKTKSE